MRIVEKTHTEGRITNRIIREMLKLSDEGALKEIRKLEKLGVIKPKEKDEALCTSLREVGD
jgi:DNA-binding Lrp family transcriptional regulator